MDGTSFDIDINANAPTVPSAAEQLAALTDRLTIAGQASIAASDAVKAGEASYRSLETAAARASSSLEKISLAADAQRGKLKAALDAGDAKGAETAAAKLQALTQRQAETAAKASAASAAMNAEAAALDKLKAKATAATDAEKKLSKELDVSKKAATDAEKAAKSSSGTGNAKGISSGLGKLGGPLGSIGQKVFGVKAAFDKLGKTLGDAGPYVAAAVAAAAVVVGLAALTAAAIAGIVAITAWGIGNADAARTSALLTAGIAGSVAGGLALDKTLHELQNKVPQTRDELAAMAADLAKSGLKGDALASALETAAVKAAKLKWGPDFAKQLLSLDNQTARLKSNIASTFGGLKIEGFLQQLSKLVELFDTSNASGRAMKTLFEALFQPLIDGLAGFIPKARTGFIQFEIMVMKAAIVIKPFTGDILMVAAVLGIMAAVLTGVVVVAIGAVLLSMGILAFAIALVVTLAVALGAGIALRRRPLLGPRVIGARRRRQRVQRAHVVSRWDLAHADRDGHHHRPRERHRERRRRGALCDHRRRRRRGRLGEEDARDRVAVEGLPRDRYEHRGGHGGRRRRRSRRGADLDRGHGRGSGRGRRRRSARGGRRVVHDRDQCERRGGQGPRRGDPRRARRLPREPRRASRNGGAPCLIPSTTRSSTTSSSSPGSSHPAS